MYFIYLKQLSCLFNQQESLQNNLYQIYTCFQLNPQKFNLLSNSSQELSEINRMNNIMNSPNRRKVCEVQVQKQAYIRHITRLQELKDGRSPEQLRRNREQKKLAKTIITVRKMHSYNRQFKQRQMKQIELQSKQTDFNKIKSVVTNDFNWPIPIIAPKHKRDIRPILNQNIKLFQRIIHAKANVASRNTGYTERKIKALPCISTSDFSNLYQNSRLCTNEQKVIKIKLGKSKRNLKIKALIDLTELFQMLKDLNSIYLLQVQYGNLANRSQTFILGELQISKILIKIPQKYIQPKNIYVKFIRILDNHEKKQILRARLIGYLDQSGIKGSNKQNSEQKDNSGIDFKIYSSKQTPIDNKSRQMKNKSKGLKMVRLYIQKQGQTKQLQEKET